MKLIVGLGNPGPQYENTRHNVGFRCVDILAEQQGWKWERRGRTMLANGTIGSEKVILAKPLTFMNNSGEAVSELVRYYKLQPEDILIIYDELDLPLGKIRLRGDGSAGGHNGIASVIRYMHTNKFPRLRVGIGRPANARVETINYVLGVPPTDERIQLAQAEERAVEAVPLVVRQGLATTMNIVNADPEAQQKAEERRRLQLERRQRRQAQQQGEQSQDEQLQDAHIKEGSA